MNELLLRAMAPVLADADATGAPVPRVVESTWPAPHDGCAFLHNGRGSGMGTWLPTGLSRPEQVATLADQVQEWVIEELWSLGRRTNWPRCPDHPHTHPLTAVAGVEAAVWTCPATREAEAAVGALDASYADPSGPTEA